MFKDLLIRGASAAGDRPAPGFLRPGRRVYAVGDPHGCLDKLRALHSLVAADLASRPAPDPWLIHLGDFIDRGPDSAGIIELLSAGDPLPGVLTVNLAGNHEAMMLAALDGVDGDAPDLWLDNGGGAALDSWRVPAAAQPAAWPGCIPPAHLRFLRGLPRQHILDGYVFVHAGLRPGVALAQQTDDDRVWIREPFLSARAPVVPDRPDLAVVHGHTVVRDPVVRPARVGVDTGAVKGGRLTAAVLEGSRVRFLQTSLQTSVHSWQS